MLYCSSSDSCPTFRRYLQKHLKNLLRENPCYQRVVMLNKDCLGELKWWQPPSFQDLSEWHVLPSSSGEYVRDARRPGTVSRYKSEADLRF